jgi:hypothetical protein
VTAQKSVALLGLIGRAEDMHAILDGETDATLAYLDTWMMVRGGRRGRSQNDFDWHGTLPRAVTFDTTRLREVLGVSKGWPAVQALTSTSIRSVTDGPTTAAISAPGVQVELVKEVQTKDPLIVTCPLVLGLEGGMLSEPKLPEVPPAPTVMLPLSGRKPVTPEYGVPP